VSPVKYELGLYIPEDTFLHSHRRENLKSYKLLPKPTNLTNWTTKTYTLFTLALKQKSSRSSDSYIAELPVIDDSLSSFGLRER
jgi:hypothetical protein